jgi:hypothetical protein
MLLDEVSACLRIVEPELPVEVSPAKCQNPVRPTAKETAERRSELAARSVCRAGELKRHPLGADGQGRPWTSGATTRLPVHADERDAAREQPRRRSCVTDSCRASLRWAEYRRPTLATETSTSSRPGRARRAPVHGLARTGSTGSSGAGLPFRWRPYQSGSMSGLLAWSPKRPSRQVRSTSPGYGARSSRRRP